MESGISKCAILETKRCQEVCSNGKDLHSVRQLRRWKAMIGENENKTDATKKAGKTV